MMVKAGASLEGKPSSGNMKVKVDATDTIAPIVTAGFTYDFKQNWFATASYFLCEVRQYGNHYCP